MKLHGACILAVLLAVACGSEDVLVFDAVPASGGAGGTGNLTSSAGGSVSSETTATATTTESSTITSTTGAATQPCADDGDCDNYFFCQKDSCSAPMGSCQTRPLFCDPNPAPVCGCDGVTYWNECYRRQFGVASSTPGECSGYARRCNVGTDCGDFPAFCAHILPPGRTCADVTNPLPEGICWVIHPRPEMVEDNNLFLLCPDATMPAPDYCADTHLAIASQFPHIRISDVADCPGGKTLKNMMQDQMPEP